MYNLATMWLTLSVIFFLCEYVTGMLQVVTLGGLVAGSFIEGAFMCLGLKLMHVIVDKQFCWQGCRSLRSAEMIA